MNTDRESIRELNIAQADAEEDNPQWAEQMREVLRQRMENPSEHKEETPDDDLVQAFHPIPSNEIYLAKLFSHLHKDLKEHIDASKKKPVPASTYRLSQDIQETQEAQDNQGIQKVQKS